MLIRILAPLKLHTLVCGNGYATSLMVNQVINVELVMWLSLLINTPVEEFKLAEFFLEIEREV
jgi:hypothetical protein